jgi:iron complex outermembrane receptor protein
MLSRAFLLLFTFLSGVIIAQRANCQIELKGFIKDAHTNQALSDVHISISPALHGTLSHTEGLFSFTDLCPGPILLKVSHLGYASLALAINLQKDTLVYISLSTKLELLPEALITQTADPKSPEKQRITADEISLNSSKGLSGLLDQLPGVNSLKTGSGLAKPMVQGLYGNRLAIINNGVSQSGQQWGIDHAPEIDPMVAKEIIVLKGVASLEYQGSSLGSVLVIKPRDLNIEPRLGGQIAHSYQSNGGGHKINLNLEQGTPFVSWRILGSLKKVGDRKSPSYYLNNTGVEEANYAFQAEKKWNSRWVSDIYLSSFNSRIGILRGSQIGNLSDLNAAFAREIPFFTQENFSYDIDAPQQMVHHMLL